MEPEVLDGAEYGVGKMRKALIEKATGLVVNIIEIEADSNYPTPAGHTLKSMAAVVVSPGDRWDGKDFVPAPVAVVNKASDASFSKEERRAIRERLAL